MNTPRQLVFDRSPVTKPAFSTKKGEDLSQVVGKVYNHLKV